MTNPTLERLLEIDDELESLELDMVGVIHESDRYKKMDLKYTDLKSKRDSLKSQIEAKLAEYDKLLDFRTKFSEGQLFISIDELNKFQQIQSQHTNLVKAIQDLKPRILAKLELLEQIQSLPDFWNPDVICTKKGIERTKILISELKNLLESTKESK